VDQKNRLKVDISKPRDFFLSQDFQNFQTAIRNRWSSSTIFNRELSLAAKDE